MQGLCYLGVGRASKAGAFTVLCDYRTDSVSVGEFDEYRDWFRQVLGLSRSKDNGPKMFHRTVTTDRSSFLEMYWIQESQISEMELLIYFIIVRMDSTKTQVSQEQATKLTKRLRHDMLTEFGAQKLQYSLDLQTDAQLIMKNISINDNNNKINDIVAQIEVVTDQMKHNVGRAINNLEDIKLIENKSVELELAAEQFSIRSNQVKKQMCLKNCRNNFIIALIIIAILLIIIVPIAIKN